ncbi:MBL fold metallo-hydrolase [Ramlibacter ginsenosidimutans]|uniref:MBL fold metallo-hydrolase n=1 Tax=Ramlibacter ginsenosidimutans TaxID=502333 RepID=A0A934TTG9_9BURK|nr:MBL fold metallo-hydrolase [Ramlibacter ginsenosidimutans]MBK6007257.1 MBL fold metallo-hydrolase [Ramlibacter ginsenosidimutans]
MKKFLSTLTLACLLGACANAPTAAPGATVDAHVAHARQLAGSDLGYLMRLCEPQPAERAKPDEKMDDYLRKLIAKPAPPAMQVFDNLYFVGGDWVSAWLLKTSEGFVLIDSLNNGQEAHEVIEGGMARLGLDPRGIRYIVVTHAHGDHYGGAAYLVRKYHPHVIASESDWNTMEGQLEFTSKLWDAPPARDITVRDDQVMTFGDTKLTFFVTTGHTLGTLSLLFDVRSHGQVHHALLWGGTSFNFGKDFSRLESYSANAERMATMAGKLPVDVLLSNHSGWDGSLVKMKALRADGAAAPNPFVTGPQPVIRSFQVMDECAQAQALRFGY